MSKHYKPIYSNGIDNRQLENSRLYRMTKRMLNRYTALGLVPPLAAGIQAFITKRSLQVNHDEQLSELEIVRACDKELKSVDSNNLANRLGFTVSMIDAFAPEQMKAIEDIQNKLNRDAEVVMRLNRDKSVTVTSHGVKKTFKTSDPKYKQYLNEYVKEAEKQLDKAEDNVAGDLWVQVLFAKSQIDQKLAGYGLKSCDGVETAIKNENDLFVGRIAGAGAYTFSSFGFFIYAYLICYSIKSAIDRRKLASSERKEKRTIEEEKRRCKEAKKREKRERARRYAITTGSRKTGGSDKSVADDSGEKERQQVELRYDERKERLLKEAKEAGIEIRTAFELAEEHGFKKAIKIIKKKNDGVCENGNGSGNEGHTQPLPRLDLSLFKQEFENRGISAEAAYDVLEHGFLGLGYLTIGESYMPVEGVMSNIENKVGVSKYSQSQYAMDLAEAVEFLKGLEIIEMRKGGTCCTLNLSSKDTEFADELVSEIKQTVFEKKKATSR